MYAEEDVLALLRLLVLLSVTQGGVPKKHYDGLRKEVIHTYGHEHILTLSSLQKAGTVSSLMPGSSARKRGRGFKGTCAILRRAWMSSVQVRVVACYVSVLWTSSKRVVERRE